MPRGRRRKDPSEAPIDGDYTPDIVINKTAGYTYKWLSADDIARFKANGYVREERGPDSARPAYDVGAESGDPDYKFGSLTLYKALNTHADRLDRIAQGVADRRMSTIRSEAKATGGDFTSEQTR